MICKICGVKKAISKKCGSKMTWNIKNETLFISGSGKMDSCDMGEYPWDKLNSMVSKVSIGKDVSEIPDNAFASLTSVKSYEVESGSKYFVGDKCLLYSAEKKKLIAIGRDKSRKLVQIAATEIGPYAGYQNKMLQTVVFTKDQVTINGDAFKNCTALKTICFWSNIKKISSSAFKGVVANAYQEENKKGGFQNFGGNLTWANYNHHPKDWSYDYEGKWEYNGKPICPEVTITTDMSLKLDYELTYHDNTFPGKGYIRVKGKGIFGGSVDLPIKIEGSIPAKDIGVTKISSLTNKGKGVEIKWEKSKNTQKYLIYRKTGNGSWSKVATTTKTTYYDTKANKNAKTYKYKIYGAVGSVKGKASGSKTIVFYKAPSGFKAKKKTSKILGLTWKKNTKVSGYIIECCSDKNFSKDVKRFTIKKPSKQSANIKFSKASSLKSVYVRMRCYKGKTYSAWTKTIHIK